MRYVSVIVLLLLVFVTIIEVAKQRIQVRIASIFCGKVINLCEAYKQMIDIEKADGNDDYEIEGVFYKMEYEAGNPKGFFHQLELGIDDALREYNKIKNKEYDFVIDDWDYIEANFRQLEELHCHTRYEAWLRGFRKV